MPFTHSFRTKNKAKMVVSSCARITYTTPQSLQRLYFTHSIKICKIMDTKWRLLVPAVILQYGRNCTFSYHYTMQHYSTADAIHTLVQNIQIFRHKMAFCAQVSCCTTLAAQLLHKTTVIAHSQQNWTQNGTYWFQTYTMQQHNQSMPFTHSFWTKEIPPPKKSKRQKCGHRIVSSCARRKNFNCRHPTTLQRLYFSFKPFSGQKMP